MLGIEPETPKAEISKSYRSLAKKWHPDRFKSKVSPENLQVTVNVSDNTVKLLFVFLEREGKGSGNVHEDCECLRGTRKVTPSLAPVALTSDDDSLCCPVPHVHVCFQLCHSAKRCCESN